MAKTSKAVVLKDGSTFIEANPYSFPLLAAGKSYHFEILHTNYSVDYY